MRSCHSDYCMHTANASAFSTPNSARTFVDMMSKLQPAGHTQTSPRLRCCMDRDGHPAAPPFWAQVADLASRGSFGMHASSFPTLHLRPSAMRGTTMYTNLLGTLVLCSQSYPASHSWHCRFSGCSTRMSNGMLRNAGYAAACLTGT